jgi:HEPN domain-containing protein
MSEDILDIKMWIQYAQEDYECAVTISNTGNPYAPRKVSYDCQQSAEKILKAFIIAKEGTCNKEHDLIILLKKCKQHSTEFDFLDIGCSTLTMYITKTRYPSNLKLTESDMNQALKAASQILEFTKSKLKELGHEYLPAS